MSTQNTNTNLQKKWFFALGVLALSVGLFAFQLSLSTPSYAQDMAVFIVAEPVFGPAPLNNVDLIVTVSGTATGDITYKFDCTNDGTFERTEVSGNNIFNAQDVCSYQNAGNYTAKVEATRDGITVQASTPIIVQQAQTQTLSVTLAANPSSGQAPLNNVDLTATVSGTATGDIKYQFDCNNDGSRDREVVTSSPVLTATDVCNFPNSGTFTAKVEVERGGQRAENTTQIVVTATTPASTGNPSFSVVLTANPMQGPAPLNNVDLIATVAGTASGDVTFKFDCTNDGTFERTAVSNTNVFTATDLCSYQNASNYTAKVEATRGGITVQGSTPILVGAGSATLSVVLSANPSSGNVPLNDVDLTATVFGTATGDITYKYDCTADGTFERTVTTGSGSHTAVDLCDYTSAGTFNPKVVVERAGLTAQDSKTVSVFAGNVAFAVEKKARNLTKSETAFADVVNAVPGDLIEFQIRITSTGVTEAQNLTLRDTLSPKIIFSGNLKGEGNSLSDNIVQGFSIGNIGVNQTKTFTFEARVASSTDFNFGTTDVINTVLVFNSQLAVTDAVTVKVSKSGVLGGATDVPTGPFNLFTVVIGLSVLAAFLLSYFFLFRFYASNYIVPNMARSKADRELSKVISRIKNRES